MTSKPGVMKTANVAYVLESDLRCNGGSEALLESCANGLLTYQVGLKVHITAPSRRHASHPSPD